MLTEREGASYNDLLDALDEAETELKNMQRVTDIRVCAALEAINAAMKEVADMTVERDYHKTRRKSLESDLMNVQVNLAATTQRAQTLERAILTEGVCVFCKHIETDVDEEPCRHCQPNNKMPMYIFDEARFAKEW